MRRPRPCVSCLAGQGGVYCQALEWQVCTLAPTSPTALNPSQPRPFSLSPLPPPRSISSLLQPLRSPSSPFHLTPSFTPHSPTCDPCAPLHPMHPCVARGLHPAGTLTTTAAAAATATPFTRINSQASGACSGERGGTGGCIGMGSGRYLWSCGLPPLFDSAMACKALQMIFENNVMRLEGGSMGAVNGMRPNGQVDDTCLQSREVWTGVTYGLAATMIYEGMHSQAFRTAQGIHQAGWDELG
ncbi:unnamed protein product [Closterium sp. Naga37s-1]|nr:unnamed protein product [Closterium sp. Naga37s-1]